MNTSIATFLSALMLGGAPLSASADLSSAPVDPGFNWGVAASSDEEPAGSSTPEGGAPAADGAETGGAQDDTAEGDRSIVEQHIFSGSGTARSAFQVWFDGGEFVAPEFETRDLTELELPDGSIAQGGDTVAKHADGTFSVIAG
ncbi:hypothetical protein [Corynebacterium frankenforstense]|uniref:hypothetical protein n=1 Tax=Corynebacterium frankenforstense TaxID=1230998 RepID=UPI0009518A30|nr:hypothetical protein [Corynebacterium frankenforstense]